jgi:hypothetical protein
VTRHTLRKVCLDVEGFTDGSNRCIRSRVKRLLVKLMTPSDISNLVGLCLGTIGGVLLSYDVIYGAGKRFQASNFKTQLEVLKRTRKLSQDVINNLPSNWTYKEKEAELAKEEREWGPQQVTLQDKVDTFYKKYEGTVVTLGAYGVMLIVLAFLLQIAGVILHAYGR